MVGERTAEDACEGARDRLQGWHRLYVGNFLKVLAGSYAKVRRFAFETFLAHSCSRHFF